jgi:hypothetical protein
MVMTPGHQRSLPFITLLCDSWASANVVTYDRYSRSASSHLWNQVPQMRRSVPTMAALLHWVLQHPSAFHTTRTADSATMLVVAHMLLLLVQDAAAAVAAKAGQPLTRRQQQVLSKKQLKQGAKQAQLQLSSLGTGPPATARQQEWETWLPAVLMEQVGGNGGHTATCGWGVPAVCGGLSCSAEGLRGGNVFRVDPPVPLQH